MRKTACLKTTYEIRGRPWLEFYGDTHTYDLIPDELPKVCKANPDTCAAQVLLAEELAND